MTADKHQDGASTAAGAGPGKLEEQAASAVAALAGRVAAQCAKNTRGELKTLRETLETAFQQIEHALAAEPVLDQASLSECVQRLRAVYESHAETRTEAARAEARTSLATAQQELEHQAQHQQELVRTIEQLRRDIQGLTAALDAQKRQVAAAREEAARMNAEREAEIAARQEAAAALVRAMARAPAKL